MAAKKRTTKPKAKAKTKPKAKATLKGKAKAAIQGRYRITEMEVWGPDYVDAEVEAYLEFKADHQGRFQFGYIRGWLDYRLVERDGKPAVEWSWDGRDEGGGDDLSGRGWALLREDGGLSGRIFIHNGDDSAFEADSA